MAELADVALNPFMEADRRDAADKAYKESPENPFIRADKAESVGVQLDTSAPVGQPGFFGGVADIGRGLAKGTISTLPEQLGKAAEFFGAPDTGRRLQDFAKEQADAHPELRQSQVGQIAASDALSVRGGAYGAGENTPLSQGPALAGAAVGAGLGAIGGPPGALAGAGLGYVVGSLAALPVFYGSQAQGSKEEIKKGLLAKGTPEAEAEQQANIGGHLSGAVEAGGELVADIIPFHALFKPFAKAVKGELVKSTLGGVGKRIATNIAGITTAEVSTEMAQQALEDQIEKQYGSEGPGATWKSTLSVVVPTALMTLFPGGFTAAHTFRSNLQVKGALANPGADPEQRAAAVSMVFHSIKSEDPVAAHAFDVYAANQIADEKPIEIKDDAGYKQDWLDRLQKPEDSTVSPLTALVAGRTLSQTTAEKMGIDKAAGPAQAAAAVAVNSGVTAAQAATPDPEAQAEAAKAAEDATKEAQKAGDQAAKEIETQRKEASSSLDSRLKAFGAEAKAVAQKAKDSAGEGEPEVPEIFKALTIASSAHWDATAATRALGTAMDAKRDDVAYAIVERAERVATEAAKAKPAVSPDSGMYAPIQAALTKKAEAARKVADKLAIMAKLQPEAGNAIQIPGTSGVLPYAPEAAGEAGSQRQGVGPSLEGAPPAETGSGGGIGRGGEPIGPRTVAGPETPTVVGQGENVSGNQENGPGPQEAPEGEIDLAQRVEDVANRMTPEEALSLRRTSKLLLTGGEKEKVALGRQLDNFEQQLTEREANPPKPFPPKREPLDQVVDYDKLEETDDAGAPTGRYAAGKIPAREALADIESRLEFAKAMRECLGV